MTCTMNWEIMSRRCLSESSVRTNASEHLKPTPNIGTHIQISETYCMLGLWWNLPIKKKVCLYLSCHNGHSLHRYQNFCSGILPGACVLNAQVSSLFKHLYQVQISSQISVRGGLKYNGHKWCSIYQYGKSPVWMFVLYMGWSGYNLIITMKYWSNDNAGLQSLYWLCLTAQLVHSHRSPSVVFGHRRQLFWAKNSLYASQLAVKEMFGW